MVHDDTFAADNLLSRGQEVQIEVDDSEVVYMELEPGEVSLHHVKLVHGSNANSSDSRRIGLAIRMIPTHVRQTVGLKDFATLVLGEDRFNHFEYERAPERDLGEQEINCLLYTSPSPRD